MMTFCALLQAEVKDVSSANFATEVEQSKGFVIVDVFAEWCQPCKKMKPIFEALSSEYPNIKFVKINSDEAKEITKNLKVTGLPTFIFFKDGKEAGRQVGYADAAAVKAKIKEIFGA